MTEFAKADIRIGAGSLVYDGADPIVLVTLRKSSHRIEEFNLVSFRLNHLFPVAIA